MHVGLAIGVYVVQRYLAPAHKAGHRVDNGLLSPAVWRGRELVQQVQARPVLVKELYDGRDYLVGLY